MGLAAVYPRVSLAGIKSLNENAGATAIIDDLAIQNETLYNGIRLSTEWPPKTMLPNASMPIPYLQTPPPVIPIDIGRQLFVDDFLIEDTTMQRQFHQPEKHEGNPLLSPQQPWEMNEGYCPMAAPFSDGIFYDADDKLFKMWYMAGWYDNKTALATSVDGLTWSRPDLDVIEGTNIVLKTPGLNRDGVSVWLDHDTINPSERFKMYMYVREGSVGQRLHGDGQAGGYLYTSPDGIHWRLRGKVGPTGDNSTFFYNPFRKQWVFTIRPFFEEHTLKFTDDDRFKGAYAPKGRTRAYWENPDFLAALGKWREKQPVFWLSTDKSDQKRANYPMGDDPQLYKIDAVGYESLMIGFLQIHYGPPNNVCAEGGFPKLTELQLAFSRDGFHWDRSNRDTFIGATLEKESWERAYIHSIGGVCNIVGDKLYFYYTAFQGDESKTKSATNAPDYFTGMYANASIGLATLRRDGFASMNADEKESSLLTRVVTFKGNYLFVNVDAPQGSLKVEICDEAGIPIPGFSSKACTPVTGNHTKQLVSWDGKNVLQALSGKRIRFKFYGTRCKLYAFWISAGLEGKSAGATAAGGPGLTGNWDI